MILVGTSGYQYPEWRGSFYPEVFPAENMLEFYAARFSTVEINYTFYRLPSEKTVKEWAQGTPPEFTFTLKASQKITHQDRLENCQELVDVFCQRASLLGPKLTCILFQMPPYFRLKADVLRIFAAGLPPGIRAAFEFRHRSWHCDEVYDILRSRNLALCITDGMAPPHAKKGGTDEAAEQESTTTPLVVTADYTYLRLRDEGYEEADLAGWAQKVQALAREVKDVHVYFKHEEAGKGPEFAKFFLKSLASTA